MSVAAWATAFGSLELTVCAFPDPMGLLRSTKGELGLLLSGDSTAGVGEPLVGGGEATTGKVKSVTGVISDWFSVDKVPRVGEHDVKLLGLWCFNDGEALNRCESTFE